MQRDTTADWQSLTQHYSQMYDEELLALNEDVNNLTEVAQQVLCNEMKKRGLDDSPAASQAPSIRPAHFPDSELDPDADSPAAGGDTEEDDLPREYTWKTLLCECDDLESGRQIRAALKQAGIESWLDGQGYRVAIDTSNPRILVAADQLEQAQEILSQPIPQSIIEQSKIEIPEYEPPVCPSCGAEDPILESADPVNSWLCESCGKQWTDQPEAVNESPA
jgi:hypothetical protein